jgi:hypothetical protein
VPSLLDQFRAGGARRNLSGMNKRLMLGFLGLLGLPLFACTATPTDDGVSDEITSIVASDDVAPAAIQLPPTVCTSKYGCGAPTGGGGSGGGTCSSGNNQCFGALGANCEGIPDGWGVPPIVDEAVRAGCLGGWCWINAGSWNHDQCCFANPNGQWCAGPASSFASGCNASWDQAHHRLDHGLNWRRRIDTCRVDTDGVVDFAEYCAPAGTIVASTDAARCCSGATRAFNATTDASTAEAQRVVFDGSFVARVCTAPPPPPSAPAPPAPKPCFNHSQCTATQICASAGSSTQKYCLEY